MVFFAYIGFDAVSSAAEEVKNPQKNMPIGIIGALTICTILYIIVSAVLTGVVPYQNLEGVGAPVAYALQSINQNWILWIPITRCNRWYDNCYLCHVLWWNAFNIRDE